MCIELIKTIQSRTINSTDGITLFMVKRLWDKLVVGWYDACVRSVGGWVRGFFSQFAIILKEFRLQQNNKMPKAKGKGGKNVKKGKKITEGERRDLIFREDGQEYAQVVRMLGDGRLALACYDDVARVGLIRGTMRRRVWINTGDIVLVGLREFDQSKADVIHKYTTEEARNLQAYDELPANARINQTAIDMAMDGGGEQGELEFEFEDI